MIETDLRSLSQELEILYPERRLVSRRWVITQAQDRLATNYLKLNFDASPEAVEENSRITSLTEAMEILEDYGDVTFSRSARNLAEDCGS
jgi:hypothetical protein